MRYFFRVEYDGSDFGGWQRQPNAISIQEKLETALQTALRTPIEITGAGRTDAGVHARGQAVHFDYENEIIPRKLELSLNALLPPQIAVYNLAQVDSAFHARFSATSRMYKYYMCMRKQPLYLKRVWALYSSINWNLFERNMRDLLGTHDFNAFCASGAGSDNTVCNVRHVSLEKKEDIFVFTIEADRFIYKMVRSVVGTLIDIGRGRFSSSMKEIIESRDRSCVGSTAPPFGLVLEQVSYPKELIDEAL